MITPLQIKLIHIAKSRIGLNEVQYRMVLHNVAGVESCKALMQSSFEDVMALLEDMGFHDTGGENYWRDKVGRRGMLVNERMVCKIETMAALLENPYPLASLVERMSNHRTKDVAELCPREAWNLIEALKVIVGRNEQLTTDNQQLTTEKCPF